MQVQTNNYLGTQYFGKFRISAGSAYILLSSKLFRKDYKINKKNFKTILKKYYQFDLFYSVN